MAALLYGSTLMLTVGGCSHEYCADVGEFQIALALWGTVHHTGYPVYMLMGSPFVTVLHWVGVPFTAGASLYSLLWEVMAVTLSALMVARLTDQPLMAVGAGMVLAVLQPFWVHGSLAEVYSLNMGFTSACLWLALDLRETWSDTKGWWLAFLLGSGIAHHRLLMVLVIVVGFYLLPSVWRRKPSWRWWAIAILLLCAGFLPYLDMWWRVYRGARWLYGPFWSWGDFWFVFQGEEAAALQRPTFELAVIGTAARDVFRLYASELTWPALILALACMAVLVIPVRHRPTLGLFGGVFTAYTLFAIVLRRAVLLEATLMAALMALVILLALGLSQLPNSWKRMGGVALCVLSLYLGFRNYPVILSFTRNPSLANYIRQVESLEAPPGAVVMAPWGAGYFALSYAHLVEGRFPQWQLVDHRANFRELAAMTGGRIYTAQDTLYVLNPEWWSNALGSPLRIASAGPNMVALTSQALAVSSSPTFSIGDGLALAGWEVRPTQLDGYTNIMLYWTALHAPTKDYSTFVHVTDQDAIDTPDDLIASSDTSSPVYGWYPTTRWQMHELVREDHPVVLPSDRPARTIFVGMYSRDASGKFIQLGQVTLREVEDQWIAQP